MPLGNTPSNLAFYKRSRSYILVCIMEQGGVLAMSDQKSILKEAHTWSEHQPHITVASMLSCMPSGNWQQNWGQASNILMAKFPDCKWGAGEIGHWVVPWTPHFTFRVMPFIWEWPRTASLCLLTSPAPPRTVFENHNAS